MSMQTASDNSSGEPMMDINTTPLIDVMLVLLIMFIITIPIQTHAVKLDLPVNQPNQTPPPIDPDDEFSQAHDPRYAGTDGEMPMTECLKDVVVRMLPYWDSDIVPDLREGQTVLVAAHGNSLRALVKHLDGISDEAISGLNIPTGIPLVYDLDDDFQPVKPGGTYLDPDAAAEGILAVANEGKK